MSMFRKPKVWLDTHDDESLLCIQWYPGPYGIAVEDLTENGVGFFAPNGELLCVEFDHVRVAADHQVLEFSNRFKNIVEVTVKKGKVSVKLTSRKHPQKKSA